VHGQQGNVVGGLLDGTDHVDYIIGERAECVW
jgi:hypothetical protein